MPIKYGEITIIYDNQNTNILHGLSILLNLLKYEPFISEESKLIVSFEEDDTIYDTYNEELKNKYKFTLLPYRNTLPNWFEVINKQHKMYFNGEPEEKDGKFRLTFGELFNSYKKYRADICIQSYFNCIYYCLKKKSEIFSVLHIKSNEFMPRYIFAYDSDEFSKEDITYLINAIFRNKFSQ